MQRVHAICTARRLRTVLVQCAGLLVSRVSDWDLLTGHWTAYASNGPTYRLGASRDANQFECVVFFNCHYILVAAPGRTKVQGG